MNPKWRRGGVCGCGGRRCAHPRGAASQDELRVSVRRPVASAGMEWASGQRQRDDGYSARVPPCGSEGGGGEAAAWRLPHGCGGALPLPHGARASCLRHAPLLRRDQPGCSVTGFSARRIMRSTSGERLEQRVSRLCRRVPAAPARECVNIKLNNLTVITATILGNAATGSDSGAAE